MSTYYNYCPEDTSWTGSTFTCSNCPKGCTTCRGSTFTCSRKSYEEPEYTCVYVEEEFLKEDFISKSERFIPEVPWNLLPRKVHQGFKRFDKFVGRQRGWSGKNYRKSVGSE